jgi:hypothetical protein
MRLFKPKPKPKPKTLAGCIENLYLQKKELQKDTTERQKSKLANIEYVEKGLKVFFDNILELRKKNGGTVYCGRETTHIFEKFKNVLDTQYTDAQKAHGLRNNTADVIHELAKHIEVMFQFYSLNGELLKPKEKGPKGLGQMAIKYNEIYDKEIMQAMKINQKNLADKKFESMEDKEEEEGQERQLNL